MTRKLLFCSLILAYSALLFPQLLPGSQFQGIEALTVEGSFLRSAFDDLSRLIIPEEWRADVDTATASEGKGVRNPSQETGDFAFSEIVLPVSQKYGVDWRLVTAVMAVESNFNPRAVSSKGARGLMQLMPRTAALYNIRAKELYDPALNVEAGVKHLKKLADRYRGNLHLVLAAYNSGETAVSRYRGVPPYRQTRTFVRKVLAHYQSSNSSR